MNCDMCGRESRIVVALVEGVEMNVCEECSRFGKVLRRAVAKKEEAKEREKKEKEPEEVIQIIVAGYAEKIKEKREAKGLTQEEFAKRVNEKESLIQHIESGKLKPSIALAQKIEKFLGIKLVEEYKEEHITKKLESGEAMTIGDVIDLKKR